MHPKKLYRPTVISASVPLPSGPWTTVPSSVIYKGATRAVVFNEDVSTIVSREYASEFKVSKKKCNELGCKDGKVLLLNSYVSCKKCGGSGEI